MKNLKKNEIKIHVDTIEPFINEQYIGFKIIWSGNIGWGEYTIYHAVNDNQWYADSECMDTNEDKKFLNELLKDFMNQIKVEE